MIQLAEMLSPTPEDMWPLLRQCGVDNAVALLHGAEQHQRMFSAIGEGHHGLAADDRPWSLTALQRDTDVFAEHGFNVVAIEDTAPMDRIRLGLDGRDDDIEHVVEQVRAMGELGIGVLCYNWMAISSWARTHAAVPARGGAWVTGFEQEAVDRLPPLVSEGEVTEDQLWEALEYFLRRVVPVAEEVGVVLGMHPDDPPLASMRGMPRIMRSPEAYRRMLDIVDSPSNAITLCQGNFALMTNDIPALIHEFGERDRIAFVHFRDVRGTADSFVETFHDEGQTDLAECMRAYHEVGFSGPMRPDHVPTMHGEDNARPGYGTLGRLFATGYIRGLQHATWGCASCS